MTKIKQVRYRPPETVDGMVHELLVRFVPDDDSPAFLRAGLLPRLRAMLRPGTTPVRENHGKAAKGVRPGSPAPWAPGPGELLDAVHHGAIALSNRSRQALGYGPLVVGTALPDPTDRLRRQPKHLVYVWRDRRTGGPRALVDLRRQVVALELLSVERRGQVPARGPVCWSCRHPSCTEVAAGQVDQLLERIRRDVARWHNDALIVLGHAARWVPLGEIVNPDLRGDEKRLGVRGPTCGAAYEAGTTSRCDHDSCWEIRKGRPKRYVQPRCPWCGSASLKQNPVTREVVCLRPSCRDEGGQRPKWTEIELRRLVAGWETPA